MALFEAQMSIAEDIIIAARSENPDLVTGDLLTDEAIATLRGSVIRLCQQFWYGTNISSKGFRGLSTQVDTTNNEVDAGESAGTNSSSVYLVYFDDTVSNPQGVHMFLGNGGRMMMNDQWFKQRLSTVADATKFYMAFVNNFLSYIGLVVARPEAVYRVKNVSSAHVFNDSVGADLLAKVPLALQADKSKFRWFMNGPTRTLLQKSRATVNVSNKVGGGGVFADIPTTCQDILIQPTDSLRTTDRAGLYH
jgi:acyl-CoA synthetase (AMP-forming)/AMP-acid ligase II